MAGVVLVTGGARGIGRAIVDALVAEGWLVAFTYHESVAGARAVEDVHQGRARAFALDLRDRDRPDVVAREIEAGMGPIAGLVNNAGIRYQDSLLAMTPDAAWDSVHGDQCRRRVPLLPGGAAWDGLPDVAAPSSISLRSRRSRASPGRRRTPRRSPR